VQRLLITTALEDTWRDDVPVVFLGEWCRRYSRTARWSKMDAEVVPYHWDDRAKFAADYQYLQGLFEQLLQEIRVQLNQIHGVNHGLRFWRILIGPWLGYFLQLLFDRWTSIQQAVSDCELSGTIVLVGQESSLVPNDMADFNRLWVGDEWNTQLYGAILQQFTSIPCILQARKSVEAASNPSAAPPSWKQEIKRVVAVGLGRAGSLLARDRDAFFLHTYLPFRDELTLYRRMGQVPQLRRSVPAVREAIDGEQRRWTVAGESRSPFEVCARALIPHQMPAVYLEGYRRLVEQAASLHWPKRPCVIWTSNAHSADDVFKVWAAEKVEQRTPLVIGQHGGVYGVARVSSAEDHETAISDAFLTWGWRDPLRSNVTPVGQLKAQRPLGVCHAQQPHALLVTLTVPRQSEPMSSSVGSRQWLDYFADQCAFVDHLPESVRRALIVRLYSYDFGWDQVARWTDRFPSLRLDHGGSKMIDLIRDSRIYIATYNGATFLESFTMDVPTVVFWDPRRWELRDSAVPFFDDLQRVGIFHDTPGSAARHVAAIWDDVDAWWTSAAVRDVLARFKARYCDLPEDLVGRVEAALRSVMAA